MEIHIKRMANRVLYFHKANDFTGSTRALANSIGEEPAVVITITPGEKGLLSEMPNIKLLKIPYPKYKNRSIPFISFVISYIGRVVQTILNAGKYDVFYINTIAPFYAAIIGRMFGKRIIYHIHEKIINPGVTYKIAEKVFYRTPSYTIYVSNYLKNSYPDKAGAYLIQYNKLSADFLQEVKIRPLVDRPLKTILMVSSLSKAKGVDTFVKIASMLSDLDFHLVLSVDQAAIDNYFVEIPHNLTIDPSQNHLAAVYYNADLLLNLTMPSVCIETFGLTILEAMAYGIPAIVPNVGGPTELVVDEENGYCVEVEDVDKVVGAINLALTPQNYARLCENTIRRFNHLYEKNINSSIYI